MRRRNSMWAVTVSQLCPVCGEDVVSSTRPAWWERIRYWLWNGSALAPILTCVNGHEWDVGGVGRLLGRRHGPRWLWLPWHLFRAVYTSRSMEPVPLTYVMAALVGTVLGVVANVLLG